MKSLALLLFLAPTLASAQQYTRGIGVYPGDPVEYTGPRLAVDSTAYRNLALRRPAYQSSAYDYNLTAQLVTDGLKATAIDRWISASTSDAGSLSKTQREVFLDGNVTSSINVSGPDPWVQFDLQGAADPPEIDRLDLWIRRIYNPSLTGSWAYTVTGSDDRTTWTEVGRVTGSVWPDMRLPGPSFRQSIPFTVPAHYRSYRVHLSAASVKTWGVAELVPFRENRELRLAGPESFSSAWMSAGSAEEWVYVDLGALCTFDRVTLDWIQPPAEGSLQISNDASQWQTVQPLPAPANLAIDIRLAQPARARYVRVLMTKPATPDSRYILSEFEVDGRGGPVATPQPQPYPQLDGPKAKAFANTARPASAHPSDVILNLTGGNWRLQRASLVPESGQQLSNPGFSTADWLIATVPGTILTSYLNVGAIPNPDYGDNQYDLSDSFFTADFWYRDEFLAPAAAPGQHLWLRFDGINWKAEIYLNGQSIGRIDGAFTRAAFDVTAFIHSAANNALAVRVLRNDNPGSVKDKETETVNGGALGRDNPTYHASAGWDWMPTIRGRDTGIWANVSLQRTGPVTIDSPLVTTTLPLPSTATADIAIQATLVNHNTQPISGTLTAQFGDITIQKPVTLAPSESQTVALNAGTYPALHILNPKLWWPNGYGDPDLYPVTLTFLVNNQPSDSTSFHAGIRQFTYSEDGGILKLWINGRRFIARGGNWGFPESMLRYRAREYETAMRYHRDQHFNMVRNWVGQTGDDAFYDAADRNGIVIWQDFWLANPWDGPDPDSNSLFLSNARDYILRIRNHASLGLFCGRNEGLPPDPIDAGLRSLTAALLPGSHYISSSADGPVSGHGPYRVEPLRYYFEHAPTKMHSEIGAPNIPELDSFRRTMPDSAIWPHSPQWELHDFYPQNPFVQSVEKDFGGADSIKDWDSLAQFVDYNSYRGMFEAQSKNRLGLLIWMSHPAWPSLLWQTYDYFFNPDAAYFAAKHASEPIHIQWNAATDAVEVVNYNAGPQPGLTARAEVLNIDGSVQWHREAALDSPEDSTLSPIQLTYPAGLSRTHFIRLTLRRGTQALSTNFYLRGVVENDYQGIRALAPARITAKSHIKRNGNQWLITTTLRNVSPIPALMVHIQAVRQKSGDPILPALYSDNYIPLMPHEEQTITTTVLDADTRAEHPRITVGGYNLAP